MFMLRADGVIRRRVGAFSRDRVCAFALFSLLFFVLSSVRVDCRVVRAGETQSHDTCAQCVDAFGIRIRLFDRIGSDPEVR